MANYCKRCGASLGEGANFCRQCGSSTGPVETPPSQSGPMPTTPLDRTEPMTGLIAEKQPPVTIPVKTHPTPRHRPLKLIGVAALLLVVAGTAFFFGSRWSSVSRESEPPIVPSPASSPAASEGDMTSEPVSTQPSTPSKNSEATGRGGSGVGVTRKIEASHDAQQHRDNGMAYLNAGQFQEAIREFEQVRKLAPGDKDVYYLIGQSYHQMQQLEPALKAYEQCTSGPYALLAKQHVARLKKKLGRSD